MLDKIKAVLTCRAVITRADGTVEDLGIISNQKVNLSTLIHLFLAGMKSKIREVRHG